MSDLRVVVEMAGAADQAGTERVRRLVVRDVNGRVIPCSGVIWTPAKARTSSVIVDGAVRRGFTTVSATSFEPGGVVLLRSGLDFGGADLDVATQLMSVLAAIHRRYVAAREVVANATGRSGGSRPAIALTPRELTMLEMLSHGLTAEAMGRRLSVTVKTVRKHLEHIYRKLGVHDRLLAVERARAEGLLGPWLSSARPDDARTGTR